MGTVVSCVGFGATFAAQSAALSSFISAHVRQDLEDARPASLRQHLQQHSTGARLSTDVLVLIKDVVVVEMARVAASVNMCLSSFVGPSYIKDL